MVFLINSQVFLICMKVVCMHCVTLYIGNAGHYKDSHNFDGFFFSKSANFNIFLSNIYIYIWLKFCGDRIYLEYWRPHLVRSSSSNLMVVIILKRMFTCLLFLILSSPYKYIITVTQKSSVKSGGCSVLMNSSIKIIFDIYPSYSQSTCPSGYRDWRTIHKIE